MIFTLYTEISLLVGCLCFVHLSGTQERESQYSRVFSKATAEGRSGREKERVYYAIIQGQGVLFFCYYVLSEMQTLQRIFLWAVNV